MVYINWSLVCHVLMVLNIWYIFALRKHAHMEAGTSQAVNFNTLMPRQNGRHFPDDIFKRIFLNQNVRIPINI